MVQNKPRPSSIQPGMLFCDRYRIEGHVDDGGMATVYRAIDESSGLPVAIKVLFPHYSDNTVVKARFLDEGRIQAMLKHPNIVHVYQVVRDPLLCFVMEFIDGETLDDYLQRKAPLQEQEIVELLMPVMSAVGFAHSKGIVHRDLKPSNVLLQTTADYVEPKVMDFGVAKVSRGKELTADGTTVGTLHYMSPEQIVGARNIDGRADIYSLGCSLYKLCTGEVPFNASSEFALMMAQVEAPPTPPRDLRPDLSAPMEEIILRALAKEPQNRFQTIKEMTQALINLGDERDEAETVTRPIPADLLEYALSADEVALDQTEHFRLAHQAASDETVEIELGGFDGATMEMSTAAMRQIEGDRLASLRRKAGGLEESSQAETLERNSPNLRRPPPGEGSLGESTIPDHREREELETERLGDDDLEEVMEMIPLSEGVVAVSKEGVDSTEVTQVHIPKGAHEDLRSTQEHSRSQRLEKLPRPAGASPPGGRSTDGDEEVTAAERPSLRNPSAPSSQEGHSPFQPQKPRQSPAHYPPEDRPQKGMWPEASTAAERPALRLSSQESLASDDDEQMSRTTAALKIRQTVHSGPYRTMDKGGHYRDTAVNIEGRGKSWIIGGVVALVVALMVLAWVVVGR